MAAIIAWALIGVSTVVWLGMFLVPFAPIPWEARAALTALAFTGAEVTFWVGVAMLGPTVATRVKRMFGRTATSFAGKTIAVFGATGGLGEAITATLAHDGAQVIALGREPSKLESLRNALGVRTLQADLTQPDSMARAVERLPELDAAIIATGVDVRKPLIAHTDAEVAHEIGINLQGPIVLTRLLIARMRKPGVIAHIGGFADGRLALPYYTVDVATRAGLSAFCEATTRELRLEGHDILVSYLCPEPTDTAAERPYAELWRRMGSQIVTREATADFVLRSVLARKSRAIMGSTSAVIAAINSASPCIADLLGLQSVGHQLRDEFGSARPSESAER